MKFWLLALALLSAGLVRSALATRLDAFTVDEAYHVTAGVAYARLGDFRLNPEHPPLVKLWVGWSLPPGLFTLPAFRPLADKPDERRFTNLAVYRDNDPDRVQARVRLAMLGLNALLLAAFAVAVRAVFGDGLALASLGLLLLDPTVAAHLPLAMTDLPVALLSTTALLWASRAFRHWRAAELVAVAVAAGLALASKHSALVTLVALGLYGAFQALRRAPSTDGAEPWPSRRGRLARLAAVGLGALALLWLSYGLRDRESPEPRDAFNRPLEQKIADVSSPFHREALGLLERGHLLPRPYLWGLADTLRASLEGRSYPVLAFGRLYYSKGPWYFFPGMLAAKLALGWLALLVAGGALLARGRLPQPWWPGLGATLGLALVFFLVLAGSSPYAGVRHALPVLPPLALVAAAPLALAGEGRDKGLALFSALSLALAALSALPVLRPWEYFNELAGGPAEAWRLFNDEGVDLGQRKLELASYYREHPEANEPVPLVSYPVSKAEMQRRGLHWLGESPGDSEVLAASPRLRGTFFISAAQLGPSPWWDKAPLRAREPQSRRGNLFIYQGEIDAGWLQAEELYWKGVRTLFAQEPDAALAERCFRQSLTADGRAFFVAIELGNLLAARGAREEALSAFETARAAAPAGSRVQEEIHRHLEELRQAPDEDPPPPLRDPNLE